MADILIVDDEPQQRDILKTILAEEGHEVLAAGSGEEALAAIRGRAPDIILTDLKMPGMSGMELLKRVMDMGLAENPAVLLMTAFGTIDSAVEAVKRGAFDYLTKPLDKDRLLVKVRQAVERQELRKENLYLRDELFDRFSIEGIIGTSEKMHEVIRTVKKVAPTNATVLILGESGTGKELIARALHYNSKRRSRSFTAINCASIPDNLLESELFGYEPGAFTGATARKKGLIEQTGGGTLFLDEIGDMPFGLQSKLLRVLQDGEIRRVGGKETFTADIRTVAATHQDLGDLIKRGKFREDLYFRLKVVTIALPPLREKTDDVPLLVDSFVRRFNEEFGKRVREVDGRAMKALQEYSWPGNIRQLASVIERAVIMSDGDIILPDDILGELRYGRVEETCIYDIPGEGLNMEELERTLMKRAMERSGNVAAKAAKLLGMSYKTFWYRWDKHGLSRDSGEKE